MKNLSFCINTANNELDYIKLLFKSLKDNLSTLEHEIIVFIDSDNQNTEGWLQSQKNIFPNLKILKNILPLPYGYARNINTMFEYANNDIVSYLQSDMVISKGYDLDILKNIKPNMILSSTRIEPPLHGPGEEKHTMNFGTNPNDFMYEEFIEYCNQNKQSKFTNYFFAPFTCYKEVWNSIGGHDTLFRRSREDSDILNRLILAGNEIVQTWDALVYHFTCTSSRGPDWFNKENKKAQDRAALQQQADRIELARMNRKWGAFSHGKPFNYFYNVTANINIDINNLEAFKAAEQFFNKTYITNKDFYDYYLSIDEHDYANELLKIDKDVWVKYSYLYNQDKKEDRIILGEGEGDIQVNFNLSDVNQYTFNNLIMNLQHIIHEYEEGEYEYENFKIVISKKENKIKEKIATRNSQPNPEDTYILL